MAYTAGNLDLTIQTISNDTIKSLDAVIERLKIIQQSLGSMNGFLKSGGSGKSGGGGSKKTGSGSVGQMGKQYLTLNKNIKITEKLIISITRQFNKQGKEIKRTSKDVDLYQKRVNKINGGIGAAYGAFGMGFMRYARRFLGIYMIRRLGQFMGNLVQASSDYLESLNLWQVSMRENLDLADEFIKKMQKAYGVSSKTLMNAQAIFKNMIGSLGQINDQTAYSISEALVQMSVDFSSLYNVKLESAFEKMQSMLAGQVRPVRSAGLDITETTLFMFYKQLGGTKAMRQLNRTEKQLLSILAVYKQLGKAGALGDMGKTINQFANQSRMMAEYWQELMIWSGFLLKDLLDQYEVIIKINAVLITITEIFKAMAKAKGIGEENFVDGLFESSEEANESIDELKGKLLDFDKFRALNSSDEGALAIDEDLLKAIAGYSSQIDQAKNKAEQLAKKWGEILGFTFDANGQWEISDENLSRIKNTVLVIGGALGAIVALGLISMTTKLIGLLKVAISPLGVVVAGVALLGMHLTDLFLNFDKMSAAEKVIKIFGAIGAAAMIAAAAIAAFHTGWTVGTAAVAIIGGLTAIAAAFANFDKKSKSFSVPMFAKGASNIDGGTLFVAGEMGKTEAVYTGSNGKTNVANVQQMEQAFYNALSRHSSSGNDKITVVTYLDGEKVYQNTTAHAKKDGKIWSKV